MAAQGLANEACPSFPVVSIPTPSIFSSALPSMNMAEKPAHPLGAAADNPLLQRKLIPPRSSGIWRSPVALCIHRCPSFQTAVAAPPPLLCPVDSLCVSPHAVPHPPGKSSMCPQPTCCGGSPRAHRRCFRTNRSHHCCPTSLFPTAPVFFCQDYGNFTRAAAPH